MQKLLGWYSDQYITSTAADDAVDRRLLRTLQHSIHQGMGVNQVMNRG